MSTITSKYRHLLYKLKKDYGEGVDIYYRTSSTVNLETGKKLIIKQKIHIKRGILLPAQQSREFLYEAAYLKEVRPFAFGGFFDIGNKIIIIDKRDLPKDFNIDIDYYAITENARFEVSKITDYHGLAYLLQTKELKGLELSQIIDRIIKDKFIMNDQALVYSIKSSILTDSLNMSDISLVNIVKNLMLSDFLSIIDSVN